MYTYLNITIQYGAYIIISNRKSRGISKIKVQCMLGARILGANALSGTQMQCNCNSWNCPNGVLRSLNSKKLGLLLTKFQPTSIESYI